LAAGSRDEILRNELERIGFVMRVKPGAEAEYKRRHEAVWPEMRMALKEAGCSNYSIFMKGQDLFAYMEVEDFERFKRHMSADPYAERWEAQMASIMERAIQPETDFHETLSEVFHLD
jgi:L-rhamnose mutarotase